MTDKELLQEALDALTYVGDKAIYSDTIDALRARLATCDRCGKVNLAELQREWVELTGKEIREIAKEDFPIPMTGRMWAFVGELVEKLKEKNGG